MLLIPFIWPFVTFCFPKSSKVVVEDANKQTDNPEELVHEEEDLDLSNSCFGFENNGENKLKTELHEILRSLIEKVRRICRAFRKSILENAELQDFILGEDGTETMFNRKLDEAVY